MPANDANGRESLVFFIGVDSRDWRATDLPSDFRLDKLQSDGALDCVAARNVRDEIG